ncbi:PREDICTED: protein fantom [Cyprinodon variegatus]|uniref:protein fantom n=1 Tax=Cyprinodon variegatus TaxID=28743 RepID=UPI000742A013|nr:PREDICTED: protein fantom [Cyprinodon variegatus]
MSFVHDETSADLPVRDIAVNLSRLADAPQDPSVHQHARERLNVGKLSREELEDRFLRVHEETLQLKLHIHKQDEKIKKLGTKLMKLVKDRGRMEQLAAGPAQPPSRFRDVEMEEMVEELQEKVRGLQAEKEGLKQRLLVAKHQLLNSQGRRQTQYEHVPSRVNSGMKKLRDDSSSLSPARHRSMRSSEGHGRPPTGKLPRYGHSLLEEARAEIRNLENVVESQQSHMEELEAAAERLREKMRRKEEEFEEKLLQARQQQTSTLRSQVNSNTSMIRLQKQLADRFNSVTELEGRYQLLQEAQQTLKASNDAALAKVDDLKAQLKDERMKNLEMDSKLQMVNINKIMVEQLQERISDLEQERELLKESNKDLLESAFDVSQQQKWQLQEQQLKLQIVQLETAQKADLADKNEVLDRIKTERDKNQQLTEENQKLQMKFLEQKQEVEELKERLKFYGREKDYSAAELTEALLLIKKRKSQKSGDLSFMAEVDEDGRSVRELRAAHAETIQELEKTRNLLNMESRISKDYKAELEAALRKMSSDKAEFEQTLARQAQLLDARAARISKLEDQLRDAAYGTKTQVFKAELTEEDESDEAVNLERGENLLELQIVGATLSPSALKVLNDEDPYTFCTYSFYLFEPHSTPVMSGRCPRYGYTSKYVVSMDDPFMDYLHRGSVTVDLHQALGVDWRTPAAAQLRLHQLLEQEGKVFGSIPLWSHQGVAMATLCDTLATPLASGGAEALDSQHFPWTPRSNMIIVAYVKDSSLLSRFLPIFIIICLLQLTVTSRNELLITVQRCRDLWSRSAQQPSPYIVYKFFDFPDYPTATVDDCCHPEFSDQKSYPILMDGDLDRYLKTEVLQFYVFDFKEEQMDTYVGKARVPLLPLTRGQEVSGLFELADPEGRPAGSLEVMLRWMFVYRPSPGVNMAAEESGLLSQLHPRQRVDPKLEEGKAEMEKMDDHLEDDEEKLQEEEEELKNLNAAAASEVAPHRTRGQKTQDRDGAGAKRVTFVGVTPAEDEVKEGAPAESLSEKQNTTFTPDVQVASRTPQSTTEDGHDDADDDEEESHVSEGQLVASAQSYSDDSDITEEITEDVEEGPASAGPQRESTQSDSDDCIVQGQASGRKLSERVRVEVVSLSLAPRSRLARDDSVVRLFVEYNFLDLPTEETPLSLPKPPLGRSINFNYSKVIPVDAENNRARRRLLREVLRGRNAQMERIQFTVVSEPPEEEEQERECEDVGVAYLRIPEVVEKQEDVVEASLNVLDVEDSSEVVGQLTVSLEGLEALRAIMEDQDKE